MTTTIKTLILEVLTGEGPSHIKEIHLKVTELDQIYRNIQSELDYLRCPGVTISKRSLNLSEMGSMTYMQRIQNYQV